MEKIFLTLLLVVVSFTGIRAQNNRELKEYTAKMKYLSADMQYYVGNKMGSLTLDMSTQILVYYNTSLAHLENVKELLSSTNPVVMYLEINVRKKIFDIALEESNSDKETISNLKSLIKLSNLYITNNKGSVPIEKYKAVEVIHSKYKDYAINLDLVANGYEYFLNKDYKNAKVLLKKGCESGNILGCKLLREVELYEKEGETSSGFLIKTKL